MSSPRGGVRNEANLDERFQSMVQILWPEPLAVTTVSRREPSVPDGREYIVVPSAAKPKLLVPRGPRRVTSAALRGYNSPFTTVGMLRLQALGLAGRVGLAAVLPNRVRVSGDAPVAIEDHLTEVLGRRVQVSMHIGPRRAVQKPVLQILSDQGHLVGFAKLGVTELTRRLVAREAANLTWLAAQGLEHLTAPTVLHLGSWRGNELLVQEPLRRPWRSSIPQHERVSAAVEVARTGGVAMHTVTGSPYWETLRGRIGAVGPSPQRDLLAAALAALPSGPHVMVPFGSWHGDWAPWNMTGSRGSLGVWDWEYYGAAAPLGFDELHFRVQDAVSCRGEEPVRAHEALRRRAAQILAPFGVGPEAAGLVSALYVVDIATRYLEDGEMEGDTTLGRLTWLESTLRNHVTALTAQDGL